MTPLPTPDQIQATVLAYINAERSVGEYCVLEHVNQTHRVNIPLTVFQTYLEELARRRLIQYSRIGVCTDPEFAAYLAQNYPRTVKEAKT